MSTDRLTDFYDDGSNHEGQIFECDHDGCLETFEAEGTFKEVWEEARAAGWRSFRKNDRWQHKCPDHVHTQ